MPNREKVRKGIAICLSRFHCGEDCPYYNAGKTGCMESLQKDTLALLKEQEPLKPFRGNSGWLCSACGNLFNYPQEYCDVCGRQVNWDA